MTDHLQRLTDAAHKASLAALGIQTDLAIASLPTVDIEARLRAAEAVFRKWRPLCAAVAELERAAPNTARKAYDHMDRIKDFAEARRAS